MEKITNKTIACVVGYNIKRIRTEHKLTAFETAKILGVDEIYLTSIEAGAVFCTIIDTINFMSAFSIKFEELLKHYEALSKIYEKQPDEEKVA